jgi:hypothetical protein
VPPRALRVRHAVDLQRLVDRVGFLKAKHALEEQERSILPNM